MKLRQLLEVTRYPEFIQLAWWRTITHLQIKRAGVNIGQGVSFLGKPIVSLFPNSKIILGDRVSLCSNSRFTALGVNHPVILRTLRSGAIIEIGNDCGMSGASICSASAVHIGSFCMFGANVTITDTDFHALKSENRRYNNKLEDIKVAPVYIGNNVFIGTGAIVLKGVTIGDNSIIGAGCVVASSVPANVVWVGSPSKLASNLPI